MAAFAPLVVVIAFSTEFRLSSSQEPTLNFSRLSAGLYTGIGISVVFSTVVEIGFVSNPRPPPIERKQMFIRCEILAKALADALILRCEASEARRSLSSISGAHSRV